MNIFHASNKSNDGAELELVDPVSLEIIEGATITLLGEDSEKAGKIKNKRDKAAINRAFKGGKKAVMPTPEEIYEQATEDLCELTVGWSIEDANGQLECNDENKRRVYTDPVNPWIREQALEFIKDRRNFFVK